MTRLTAALPKMAYGNMGGGGGMEGRSMDSFNRPMSGGGGPMNAFGTQAGVITDDIRKKAAEMSDPRVANPTKSVMVDLAARDKGGYNMSSVKDASGKYLTNAEAMANMPKGGYQINMGEFGGMGHGAPIDAHPHGDTFADPAGTGAAERAAGVGNGWSGNPPPRPEGWTYKAGGPLSQNYQGPHGFAGLKAHGTAQHDRGLLGPLQPFIAGDPQKNGRPNPELIVPTRGGTHVIPLQDFNKLPKRAMGTGDEEGNSATAMTRGEVAKQRFDETMAKVPKMACGTGNEGGNFASATTRGEERARNPRRHEDPRQFQMMQAPKMAMGTMEGNYATTTSRDEIRSQQLAVEGQDLQNQMLSEQVEAAHKANKPTPLPGMGVHMGAPTTWEAPSGSQRHSIFGNQGAFGHNGAFGRGYSRYAHGGRVAPLRPFIAGDPQKRGVPNPELIVPSASGTQVIPLGAVTGRGLPKLSKGTSGRRSGSHSSPGFSFYGDPKEQGTRITHPGPKGSPGFSFYGDPKEQGTRITHPGPKGSPGFSFYGDPAEQGTRITHMAYGTSATSANRQGVPNTAGLAQPLPMMAKGGFVPQQPEAPSLEAADALKTNSGSVSNYEGGASMVDMGLAKLKTPNPVTGQPMEADRVLYDSSGKMVGASTGLPESYQQPQQPVQPPQQSAPPQMTPPGSGVPATGAALPPWNPRPDPNGPFPDRPHPGDNVRAELFRKMEANRGSLDPKHFETAEKLLSDRSKNPEEVRAGLSRAWKQNQDAQAQAQQQQAWNDRMAPNPNKIDVGVTPRPALTGFAQQDAAHNQAMRDAHLAHQYKQQAKELAKQQSLATRGRR